MSELKPLILYDTKGGPNPIKVRIILEEMGLPYTIEKLEFAEMKKEPFVLVNPNGRVPGLVDPNRGDIKIWESGAIIEYLIDTYDTEAKFHYTTPQEKWSTHAWAYFQVSGQGPYMGQLGWFACWHGEEVPSAIERYRKETIRIVDMMDAHLKRQGTEYIVGDRMTYADLMLIPWFHCTSGVMGKDFTYSKWQTFNSWLEKMMARPAVQKALEGQTEIIKYRDDTYNRFKD